jgi:hypothetical protein
VTRPLSKHSWLVAALALSSASCGQDSPSTTASQAGTGGGSAGAPLAGSGGSGTHGGDGNTSGGTEGIAGAFAGSAGRAAAGASGSSSGAAGTAPSDEGLSVTPAELVFGAVQQTSTDAQKVVLENVGSAALQIDSVKIDPATSGAGAFELISAPAAETALAAGAKLELMVRFHPTSIALFESALVIEHDTGPALSVTLFGLGTKGLEGENEPFLKIVLDTLGYDVDVGGSGLLSTTTPLVGSEVAAQRFKAKGAAPVELLPVARYSPQEPIPYGFYTTSGETKVGTISNDQYQALNPTTDAGSERTFEPPAGEFGLYTVSKTHTTYTEDSKNAANQVKHAARTYPLRDRAGTAVADAFLVCFEEAANGDYQDYVFTLKNVVPVAP